MVVPKFLVRNWPFFSKNVLRLPTFVLWSLKQIQIYSICANKMSHIIEKMTHPRFFIERSFSSKKCDYLQEGEFKWFQLKKRQERFREIGLEKLRIPKNRWVGQIFSRNPWIAIVHFLDNSMDNQHRDWFLSEWYEKIIGFRLNKSGSICFVRTDADNKSLEWKWKGF